MRATKFQTLVDLPGYNWKCSYDNTSIFIGSCFTENVGKIMEDLKYAVDINPYGILYNPMSVGNCISSLLAKKHFIESDLVNHNGLWNSFSHHGKFSEVESSKVLERINKQTIESSIKLKSADFLFVTFGTAWVYRYNKNGEIVSNCHKIPAKDFSRERLSVKEIVEYYQILLAKLWDENPKLKIVFTVSPIRHWKDGAVENQRSKSTLILAIDELIKMYGEEKCAYFPSYEIVMDELRDYRFYTEDMLHLNEVAVKHIWQIFEGVLVDDESRRVSLEVKKIINAAGHRPFNKNTPEHVKFLKKYLELSQNLEAKHLNINLKLEKEYFAREMNKNESGTLDS